MENSISVNRMLTYALVTLFAGIGFLYYKDQQDGLEQARITSQEQQSLISQQQDKLRQAEERLSELQKAAEEWRRKAETDSGEASPQQDQTIGQLKDQIEQLKARKSELDNQVSTLTEENAALKQALADSIQIKNEEIGHLMQKADSLLAVEKEKNKLLEIENQDLRMSLDKARKQTGEVMNLVLKASNAELEADRTSNLFNINRNKKYQLYAEAARIYKQLNQQYLVQEAEEHHHRVLKKIIQLGFETESLNL